VRQGGRKRGRRKAARKKLCAVCAKSALHKLHCGISTAQFTQPSVSRATSTQQAHNKDTTSSQRAHNKEQTRTVLSPFPSRPPELGSARIHTIRSRPTATPLPPSQRHSAASSGAARRGASRSARSNAPRIPPPAHWRRRRIATRPQVAVSCDETPN